MKLDALKRLMKTRGSKTVMLAAAVVLVLCLVLGGTLAYLSQSSEGVVNNFTPAVVDFEIDETFENGVKQNIQVRVPATEGGVDGGTQTIEVYVRATVVANWQRLNADQSVDVIADFDVPTLPSALGNGWVKGADGYYYYTKALKPGDATDGVTSALFKDPINNDLGSNDRYLNVTILVDAIQADGNVPISTYWASVASVNNGVLSITTG